MWKLVIAHSFWRFWCSQDTQKWKSSFQFFSAKDIFYSGQAILHVLSCSVVYDTLNGMLICSACYIGHDNVTVTLYDPSRHVGQDTVDTTTYVPACYVGHETLQHCMILHSLLIMICVYNIAICCILRCAQYCLCNTACFYTLFCTLLFKQHCTFHNDLCENFRPMFQLETAIL